MRVLIVDDTEDVRRLLALTLRVEGFETCVAAGGPEALAILDGGFRPDLVLLDVQMPVMDGWDTLAAIRRNPRTAELCVILCTVKSRPDDRRRGWELGCDGYISKPFDLGELVELLRDVAARSPVEREAARTLELSVLQGE